MKGVGIMQSREEILNILIDALLEEIAKTTEELREASPSQRQKLRYTLRDLSLALARLLDRLPEETDIEQWWREIERKIPKERVLRIREKTLTVKQASKTVKG
ncbi:hypothetical protein CW709_02460 [Candidatus Bathyarchaeota archaeon]|nr:MAG: hypothetical protein CW709_02460 [Candidatus Bathyarchaeota archaeon]